MIEFKKLAGASGTTMADGTVLRAARIVLGGGLALAEDADGLPILSATLSETIALDSLSDVTITTVAAGDILQYSGTFWVNKGGTSGNRAAALYGNTLNLLSTAASAQLVSCYDANDSIALYNIQGTSTLTLTASATGAPARRNVIMLVSGDSARAQGVFTKEATVEKWFFGKAYNSNDFIVGYDSGGTPEYTTKARLLITTAGGATFTAGVSATTGTFSGLVKAGGATAEQASPYLSVRGGKNGIEFGHTNAAGYGSVIGFESNNGRPFVAFSAEHGTNVNTYMTRGKAGSVLQGDLAGGFLFGTVPNTSADNQTLTTLATLSSAGELALTGRILTTLITEQLRLRYDSSNYLTATVAGSASTTFALTASSGTPTFSFSNPIGVTGYINITRTGTSPNFAMRRGDDGTNGLVLSSTIAGGRDTSANYDSGTIQYVATETWSGTAGGGRWDFAATAQTTRVQYTVLSLTAAAITGYYQTILDNATPATVSTTNSAPPFVLRARYWDGGSSQLDYWTFATSLAAGANGQAQITLSHVGSSSASNQFVVNETACFQKNFYAGTWSAAQSWPYKVSAVGAMAQTTPTAATAGANSSSPTYQLVASVWNGGAAIADYWQLQNVVGTGTNPTSVLTFSHAGTSGATGVLVPSLQTSGTLDVGTSLYHRYNIGVLNKAGNNWVTWATRNTAGAESVMDLANIGTLATGGNLTVGSLGVLDSTQAPAADAFMVYSGTASKWQPRGIIMAVQSGVSASSAWSVGTIQYVNTVPSPSGAQGSAPTVAPQVSPGYRCNIVDMSATTLPANCVYEISVSDNGGAYGAYQAVTSSTIIHTLPSDTGHYYTYKYRIKGAGTTGDSPASANSYLGTRPEVAAFGLILASQIAVQNLSALSAHIGDISAGQMRNAANTRGITLTGSPPGGWTTYLNLAPAAGQPILHHTKLDLNEDGSATFGGAVVAGTVRDTASTFVIDLANSLLTVTDTQVSPKVRVKIGKIGAYGDYRDWGIQLFDNEGDSLVKLWGGSLGDYGQLRLGKMMTSGILNRHSVQFDGIPNIQGYASPSAIDAQLQFENQADLPTGASLWRWMLRRNSANDYTMVLQTNRSATGGVPDFATVVEHFSVSYASGGTTSATFNGGISATTGGFSDAVTITHGGEATLHLAKSGASANNSYWYNNGTTVGLYDTGVGSYASWNISTKLFTVPGGISTAAGTFTGQLIVKKGASGIVLGPDSATSGEGGNIRFRDDAANLRWMAGIGGAAGQTTWVLYDLIHSTTAVSFDATTGAATFGAGISATTGTFSGVLTGYMLNMTNQNQINATGYNGVDAIVLNYVGYQGGTTQYRNLSIYDGKNNLIALFTGNGSSLSVYGPLDAYKGTFANTTDAATVKSLIVNPSYTAAINASNHFAVDLTPTWTVGGGHDVGALVALHIAVACGAYNATTTLSALYGIQIANLGAHWATALTGAAAAILIDAQNFDAQANGTAYGLYVGDVSNVGGTAYSIYTNAGAVRFGGALTAASGAQITGAGLQLGSPTGGDKGAGTINVATNIFKNNTAYTNPDFVLEHYFTGRVDRYSLRNRAEGYEGLWPLAKVREYAKEHLRLPRITDSPAGIFDMADIALEKIEELFLYVFELEDRISHLESALAAR